MQKGLTSRQTQILKSLIDEYIETAEPVGSQSLEKKYNLGVSPATIRFEMAALSEMGYLKQPHTSAGRIPTSKALKFYVDQLMDEKEMSLTEEVRAKEQVWDARADLHELIDEATQALAEYTKSLAVGTINDEERIWHSGYSNIFLNPEFSDRQMCANLFSLLEEAKSMHEIFFERLEGASPVEVLFGEDIGLQGLSPIGIVATQHNIRGKNVALGVIGPARLSYSRVVPVLRYFGNLIEEVTR